MTGSNAGADRNPGLDRPDARDRAARIRRARTRPIARSARKGATATFQPPAPHPETPGDIDSTQTLSVEYQPIGGIFGAANPLMEDDESPGRLGRLLRRRSGVKPGVEPALLDDFDFRVLWLSRLLSQTAQGALLYALLILVVDLSDRTVFNSLFVICSIIPSIAFGLPAGVVTDTVPRRGLLVLLNLSTDPTTMSDPDAAALRWSTPSAPGGSRSSESTNVR